MASTNVNPPPANPALSPAPLPAGQLESLRSKINSMVESIGALQMTIDQAGQNWMPTWPDILSKYTVLLSQSHSLSTSLVAAPPAATTSRVNGHSGTQVPTNPYERLALHPIVPMSDAQLDNDLIPLLRNQQTTDVLKIENDTVRHLAEHMSTRGSLGVLGMASASSAPAAPRSRFGAQERKPEYSDVLRECEQIRIEHDERVERAVRAVMLLREKFEWKARWAVEKEEPEELEWMQEDEDSGMNLDGDNAAGQDKGEESNESEEEEELEEVLGNGEGGSQPGTPEDAVENPSVPMNQD